MRETSARCGPAAGEAAATKTAAAMAAESSATAMESAAAETTRVSFTHMAQNENTRNELRFRKRPTIGFHFLAPFSAEGLRAADLPGSCVTNATFTAPSGGFAENVASVTAGARFQSESSARNCGWPLSFL